MPAYNIRYATLEDIPEILSMGSMFIKYHPMPMSFDEKKLKDMAINLITKGIFLVAEYEGRLAGMIAGIVGDSLFDSNLKQATEYFWWVNEEHRKGTVGLKLFDVFHKVCVDSGADILVVCHTVQTPQLEKIFVRKGFSPIEFAYCKNLKEN